MKANGVRETTTTTGTGVVTLAAVTGYVRFADAHTVGDVVDYAINNGSNWEWGRGTVGAANTLARTTVKSTYVAGVYNSSPAGPITLSGQSAVIEAPIGESAFDPASPGPIGGTTPNTAAFTTVTMMAGTLTSAQAIEASAATWNNAAEKMVGRSVDITDTASHVESYLDLLKVGGVRKSGVRKDGALILWNGANDDTNYERGFMRWNTNVLEIGTEKAGTGSARDVLIKTNAINVVTFNSIGATIIHTPLTCQSYATFSNYVLTSAGVYMRSNTAYLRFGTADDASLDRIGAGIIGVRNGSTGGAAISMVEQTAPAAPAANGVYIYAQDNGAGKTQLMALFATGVAQQIAIEP